LPRNNTAGFIHPPIQGRPGTYGKRPFRTFDEIREILYAGEEKRGEGKK
jgi:hypothetical protein